MRLSRIFFPSAGGGGAITVQVDPASETDSASAVTPINPNTVAVGSASETDAASPVASVNPNSVTVGAASETDASFTVTPVLGTAPITVIVGAASETDSAFSIAVILPITVTVGPATETDSASSVTPVGEVIKGVSITLYTGSTEQVSITGITAMWWDSSPPTGNPVYTSATASTDAAGLLKLDLAASTSLAIDGLGHLMLYKLDGVDQTDSLAWQGQLPIVDVG